eukprot:UN01253
MAHDSSAGLRNQSNTLGNAHTKTKGGFSSIPQLNEIIDKIKYYKQRDMLVLAGVCSSCIIFCSCTAVFRN